MDLLWEIHEILPLDYAPGSVRRTKGLIGYFHRAEFTDDVGNEYLFVLAVNDSASPDHLIIADVGYFLP